MSNPSQGALLAELPFPEQCLARMRALFSLEPAGGSGIAGTPDALMWDRLALPHRRFLAQLADVSLPRLRCAWGELGEAERARLIDAWAQLAELVDKRRELARGGRR